MTRPAHNNGSYKQSSIAEVDDTETRIRKGIKWTHNDIKGIISLAELSNNRERLRVLNQIEKLLASIRSV